jgi:hypothetical protein
VRKDLTIGQRLLRSVGLTVLLMTAVVCGLLAATYVGGDQFSGWRQPVVVFSLFLAAVAALAMTIDSFDLWMLGRRITQFSVRMVHSLVFVSMLAAFALSIISGTPGLLLVVAPALVVYLFTVLRSQPTTQSRPADGQGGGSGRQRRGGKKHK